MKLYNITKINWIDGLIISVVFDDNSGDRIINFNEVLSKIGKDSPANILLDPQEFNKVKIRNKTLSWDNVDQYIMKNGKKIMVPFEIGSDALFKYSKK